MRRLFVGACILSASVFALFACSSDSTGTTTTSDAGHGGTDGSTTNVLTDAGKAVGDGGVTPTGCTLIGTDAHAGKKAVSVPRTENPNGIAWTNPEGALDVDGNVASVTIDDGQESAMLEITDFGFEIPAGYETWGMVLQLKRQTTTTGGVVQTAYVNVGIDGKTPGYKYDNDNFYWPTSIMGTHDYGQPIDTWGVDLYPADINASTFAAKLWVKKGTKSVAGPVTATVEALRVIVWVCPK